LLHSAFFHQARQVFKLDQSTKFWPFQVTIQLLKSASKTMKFLLRQGLKEKRVLSKMKAFLAD